MNRRRFLKVSGAAFSYLYAFGVPASGQSLLGEDLPNLERSIRRVLGRTLKDLIPSTAIRVSVPARVQNGSYVPLGVSVDLLPEQVRAVYLFADKNPEPHLLTARVSPQTLPRISSGFRFSGTTAVRAIVETVDGKLLLASTSVQVDVGSCNK